MALTEKQVKFVELYANKGKSGKTNSTIATELGIDQASLYRWKNNQEVKEAINRACAEDIDSMLPNLIANAENMLSSNNANEKAKGTDIALKLMEKVKLKDELSIMDREKILIKEFIFNAVESSLFLKDISPRMFLEVCCESFVDNILRKGYTKAPATMKEIESFVEDSIKYEKALSHSRE